MTQEKKKFVEDILVEHFALVPAERKESVARALRDSFRVELNGQSPIDAQGLNERYGLSIGEQHKWLVCLTRPNARLFLDERTSIPGFEKRFKVERYRQVYGKSPILYADRPNTMFLTYAEWLGLVGVKIQVPLPEEIKSYCN